MKDRHTDSPEDKPRCTQHPDTCSNPHCEKHN